MSGPKEIPASERHSDPSDRTSIHSHNRKQLTKADSPPPDPGIIRDMPSESMPGDLYVASDVNIMFFSEEALRKLDNGEKMIIVPNPDKSVYVEFRRKLNERFPGLNRVGREICDQVRMEWGR
jgi:hypothetical protein